MDYPSTIVSEERINAIYARLSTVTSVTPIDRELHADALRRTVTAALNNVGGTTGDLDVVVENHEPVENGWAVIEGRLYAYPITIEVPNAPPRVPIAVDGPDWLIPLVWIPA